MSSPTKDAAAVIEALETLAGRFEANDIDVPGHRARIRLEVTDGDDQDAVIEMPELRLAPAGGKHPDATLAADAETWTAIAEDVRGGMDAFRRGRLQIRDNLHLGIGFLAATSGSTEPERLRLERVWLPKHEISTIQAGTGPPLICIHGLGGTKASFMTTVSALAPLGHRVIAIDLPGFGDSSKPLNGDFNAMGFSDVIRGLLDELGIERASFAGNSMGGRIAIELGIREPERVEKLVLLAPAMAWLKERPWKWLLQMPLPRLGYLQPTPRWAVEPIVRRIVPGGETGWTKAGIDEFLRAYCTPAGRYAFYECARNIYRDEPYGEKGFWTRLKKLSPEAMFVWGRQDTLVPIEFMRHVERALPRSRHVELECGHVPQMEMPGATHEAMAEFLSD
jgi:pimeloyl-ACP methyl ester carboxylesterase